MTLEFIVWIISKDPGRWSSFPRLNLLGDRENNRTEGYYFWRTVILYTNPHNISYSEPGSIGHFSEFLTRSYLELPRHLSRSLSYSGTNIHLKRLHKPIVSSIGDLVKSFSEFTKSRVGKSDSSHTPMLAFQNYNFKYKYIFCTSKSILYTQSN
jgi:hypothetical protein